MPKIFENGIIREMTQEETTEMETQIAEMPELEITPEQRLDEIEAAMMELANLIGGE